MAVQLGLDRALVPPSAVELGGDGDGDDEVQEAPAVPRTPVRLGDGGPLGMVSDPQLACHLTGDAGVVGAYRFVAELTAQWLEAPSDPRGVVVHIPPDATLNAGGSARGPQRAGRRPGGAACDARTSSWPRYRRATTAPRSVESLPPTRSPTTGVRSTPASWARPGRASTASASCSATHCWPRRCTSPCSSARAPRPPTCCRTAYVDRVNTQLGSVEGAVTLPDEFRITLTARTSSIPIRLTNLSDEELTVRVELDSDQLEFPDGAGAHAHAGPGHQPDRGRRAGSARPVPSRWTSW